MYIEASTSLNFCHEGFFNAPLSFFLHARRRVGVGIHGDAVEKKKISTTSSCIPTPTRRRMQGVRFVGLSKRTALTVSLSECIKSSRPVGLIGLNPTTRITTRIESRVNRRLYLPELLPRRVGEIQGGSGFVGEASTPHTAPLSFFPQLRRQSILSPAAFSPM